MTKLAEKRAEARVRSAADIGLMVERTMSMGNGLLDLLESEFVEFKAGNRGEPKNFTDRLTKVANLLDALTLSYARFKKAEREWSESMSPEEKLEAVTTFAVAMYKERPDYVSKWATGLLQALQAAGDSTKAIANRIDAVPVPRKNMTMDDVIEAAAAQDDGWAE
jgi:hypothetical protein